MAPEPSLPETVDLDVFLEYHLTSMLLSLVVAIVDQSYHLNPPEYEPPLDKSLSLRRRALDGLTDILVRNAEVVAVTTSGFRPPPGSYSSRDTPNTLEILVMQEETNSTSTTVHSQCSGPPTLAQEPWLTTIPLGQSKFGEIMASPWSCVAKP
jgi:hypothetical protein